MTTVLGLCLGAGAFLVWWSLWVPGAEPAARPHGWSARTQDRLVQAGVIAVSPQALLGTALGLGLATFVLVTAVSDAPGIAACFSFLAARAPFALIASRARSRQRAARAVWPEAVDHLASGIRAGLSLPTALAQLGDRGPEQLREPFSAYARDFRATGRFGPSLDALKARLADPVADRIIEALRVTRDVGGTDVGTVLRTLSEFLRDDARTRGELEARQSWTVNAARLAVAAPWMVLALLATRPANAAAFNSPGGLTVLVGGGVLTVVAYRVMTRIGRLPVEERVMR